MGTDKRERQKANRALKQQELAKQHRTSTIKRNGVRFVVIGLVAIAGVIGIVWATGGFDDDESDTVTGATSPESVADSTPSSEPESSASSTPGSTPSEGAPVGTDADGSTPTSTTECPAADGSSEQVREFDGPPPMCIDPEATYTAEVVTNQGDFTVELDPSKAPDTVNNFVVLARYHYYDDTVCHRIIPGFVVQCGDPTGTGTGGPGYQFDDELPEAGEYQIGSLAMANSGANTNGSQFFIISGDDGTQLPPQYSLFGQVTDGLDSTIPALDALGNPDPTANGVPPIEEVRIESVTITEGAAS